MRPLIQSLVQDVPYAVRQLRRAPGFAVAAVLTLALGIGATTAMLAVVDSVLLQPLALPHAERLVSFERLIPKGRANDFSLSDLHALRAVGSFDAVSAYSNFPTPVTTAAGTRVTHVVRIGPEFFRVAGATAQMGRLLSSNDAHQPAAVATDAFWREILHSDPHAVGTSVKVGAQPVTIVGILPARFAFPEIFTGPSLYLPWTVDAQGKDDHGFDSRMMIARIKPGVTFPTAQAEAGAAYAHAPTRLGESQTDRGKLLLVPYSKSMTGEEQPALLALLGACGLLLLIACANSANLQMARGATRGDEMSVRAALGASRPRLLRQLVTESLTISLLGAGLGLVLAQGALWAAKHAYADRFARFDELALHPGAYLGCTLLAVLAGVLAALAPAWNAVRDDCPWRASQPTQVTGNRRLSSLLVAAEIALTCVLLTTAGLFLRTFQALQHVPLGFNPHHVTEVSLMPIDPHQDLSAAKGTYDRLLARLAAMPGIEAAATQTSLPFSNFTMEMTGSLHLAGRPKQKHDAVSISLVSPGYARTMGVPLLQGRGFTGADGASAPVVAIANEAAARRFLRGTHVLGQQVEFGNDATDGTDDRLVKTRITIEGGIPHQVASSRMGEDQGPMLLLSYKQVSLGSSNARFLLGLAPQFAVRSALPQVVLEREIRTALKDAAPSLAEMNISPVDEKIDQVLATRRLALRLATGFGAVALLLAAVGIYSILACSVAARTREIGIRMALGSTRGGAMRLVLRQAAALVALGLAGGVAGAWPAERAVRSFLYGVATMDPLTLASVALLLLAVCAVAAAAPVFRATKVDPMQALRTE